MQARTLPSYAHALSAFHSACAEPLRQIIDELPVPAGGRILDVPCGDGTYLSWLAERAGPAGRVVGADANAAYLETARREVAASRHGPRISFVEGEIARLPFADGSFDFAWCAHSLYSLPDPATVLHELTRLVRRGGGLGILENDSFHHWLLPWPVELELAVRQAQLTALEEQSGTWQKHYVGRRLAKLLTDEGLTETHIVTKTIDHEAPLSADERAMIGGYLAALRELTWERLSLEARREFDAFVDGRGEEPAAIDCADFFAAHLEIVATARKP